MLNDTFFNYANKKISEGQFYFASHLKLMVESVNKELFDLLDHDNDAIFLNPMLFAFLNADPTKITLEQILYGSISEQKRPERITVLSNCKGEIYLPNYGCLQVAVLREQHYELITNNTNNRIQVFSGNILIPHFLKTNPKLPGTNIEIQCASNYMTDLFLPESNAVQKSFCSKPKKIKELKQAVAILQQHYPHYYSLFSRVTKCLVPFTDSKANSFAALGMHGAGFINTFRNTGVVYYLEDIVHQCGHVIFSTLTHEPAAYFTIPPETPVTALNNDQNDDRNLYVLFHGVFTEALMCEAFDICLQKKIFDPQQEHELKGRFAYILLRFVLDMQILINHNHFSEEGQLIFNEIYNHMADQYKRNCSLLLTFDLTNQPYNFDYNKFMAKNKMQEMHYS